ncbi:MAG: hypothetical protein SVU32_07770 [Candidatus Nanohaloarchaea archaeon]|nr:hypothetical protein [Candidatus Nanohaloarchaea archaeon]
MQEQSFDDLAERIETFVAQVEVYDAMVARHRPGAHETADRINRYITEGIEDSDSLVETWIEASEAAEELMDREYEQERSASAEGPSIDTSPGVAVYREEVANRLWNEFYVAQQTITEHERYALRHFDCSPASYRREVDADYG